ncbi:MAG: hypothetical protein ACXWR1_20525, partial [Bdellovibrionota bacterium]
SVPEDYLACLNRYYEDWIGAYDTGKLLIIDSDELDFVAHPEHFDLIAKQILDKIDQRELFLPLASPTARAASR